jgi:anti-sigma factor RsiW
MRRHRGHLGTSVSALVDGQLDVEAAELAWSHALACRECRLRVAQEGRVKTELAALGGNEPPAQLLGRLYSLDDPDHLTQTWQAWAAVEEIERRHAARRRAGLAVIGAGSVSAAVFGFASLSGATLGIGQPASTPTATLSRPGPTTAVISPAVVVHGRLLSPERTREQRRATHGSSHR